MIYTTGSIAVNGNTLTGTGTNFTAAGSLIRVGCSWFPWLTGTGIPDNGNQQRNPAHRNASGNPAIAAGYRLRYPAERFAER
jgi:hypothetical protein